MVATVLWHTKRPNLPVAWAWTTQEDQLIWRRAGAGAQFAAAGCEPVEPTLINYHGANPNDDVPWNGRRGGT
jgi:hypothetical protein